MCVPCHTCCGDPILLSMQLTFCNAEIHVSCFQTCQFGHMIWGGHLSGHAILYLFAGGIENQSQKLIRKAVQGVFAASMHPRTAVQVIIQVWPPLIPCFHGCYRIAHYCCMSPASMQHHQYSLWLFAFDRVKSCACCHCRLYVMVDQYCRVRSMRRVQLWLMLVCSFTTCLVSFTVVYVIVCSFLLTASILLLSASSAKPVSLVGGRA